MSNQKTHRDALGVLKQHKLTLPKFEPRSHNQKVFMESAFNGKSKVLWGSAGTGKTFLGLYAAFAEIFRGDQEYRRVVVIRSAVETRSVGHLPGTLEEKSLVYERAAQGVIEVDIFNRKGIYETLKDKGVLEFMLTSYIRGITYDHTLIIVEEAQNMTAHELDSVITRCGEGSRLIITGDYTQTDFSRQSDKDVELVIDVISDMPDFFDTYTFTTDDVCRSGLVKEYLKAKEIYMMSNQDKKG